MEMNRYISEAHNNEYNPLYYSVDSTKAVTPSGTGVNSEYNLSPDEQETLDCIENYTETKYIH